MYYQDPSNPEKKILAGFMYRVEDRNESGRQIGGPVTRWHYHTYPRKTCLTFTGPMNAEDCPGSAQKTHHSREMIHVWFVDHPESQFATGMYLPPEVVGERPELMSKKQFIEKHNRTY